VGVVGVGDDDGDAIIKVVRIGDDGEAIIIKSA
jgi:hypothetical protein